MRVPVARYRRRHRRRLGLCNLVVVVVVRLSISIRLMCRLGRRRRHRRHRLVRRDLVRLGQLADRGRDRGRMMGWRIIIGALIRFGMEGSDQSVGKYISGGDCDSKGMGTVF